jgi:hypothetical protein
MGPACAQRAQRAIGAAQPIRASAERENEREAPEYMDGTGCSNCRECELRVWGARCAHIARSAEQKQIVAYSQTDTGARTSDPAQPNLCPPTDTGSSILYFSKMASVMSCPILSCPVRYRRPNGFSDRSENWHTHSLELCDEDRGSAIESAHLCARNARKCARSTTYPA